MDGRKEVNPMAKNEKTSNKIGKIASQGMRAPSTLSGKQIKSLAASALTQRPDKTRK
jgi:hypothetical protein